MHSSTSSSKLTSQNEWERNIPDQNWKKIFFISLFVFALLTLGWELYWRGKGYSPSLDDNKDLWAYNRRKVEANPSSTVLVGASRMLFDFDLSVYRSEFNVEPIQLATVGTNATYYLSEIANHSRFNGTLIVDVLPLLFFVPEGMPVDIPVGNIKYAKDWNYAQKASFFLGLFPDRLFSFLEPDDLSMRGLLAGLPLTDREGVASPPRLPPHFLEIQTLNRQGLMTRKAETEQEFQKVIQQRWIPLFTPPPPPPRFTRDEFIKMFMEHVDATLVRIGEDVAKIQARGGKVIFVRYPSTGTVRELENQFTPNVAFWDRIRAKTHPNFSVSFEDHPELQGFECPEWSHLSRADATEFTKRLLKILKAQGAF